MITRRHFIQTAACAAAVLAAPRAFAIGNPSYPCAQRGNGWCLMRRAAPRTSLSRLICQRLSDRLGRDLCGREQARRRQQYRHTGGDYAVRAGRLYAAADLDGECDQRLVRSGAAHMISPRASRRWPASRAFRWCWSSTTTSPVKTVADFVAYAKANPGQDVDRLLRHRHLAASVRRIVQVARWRPVHPRALSRLGAGTWPM